MVWVGILDHAEDAEGGIQVHASTAESVISTMPLRWEPPRVQLARDSEAARHWWRQLLYAFDIEDPRTVPPLPEALSTGDAATSERFVYVSAALAQSNVLSSNVSITVTPGAGEEVLAQFPPIETQTGFSALLRQCDRPNEPASYRHVHAILWRANELDRDDLRRAARQRALEGWSALIKSLHRRSLNQLVRDKLVAVEGWRIFEYVEDLSPEALIRAFNYGDLIHWGDRRPELATGDALSVADQRFAFLSASVGLAYALIGFGELVRAAITPPNALWVPE